MQLFTKREIGSSNVRPYNMRSLVTNRLVGCILFPFMTAGHMTPGINLQTNEWIASLVAEYEKTNVFFKDMVNIMRIYELPMDFNKLKEDVLMFTPTSFSQTMDGAHISDLSVLMEIIDTPVSDNVVRASRNAFVSCWLSDLPCFEPLFNLLIIDGENKVEASVDVRKELASRMWRDNENGIRNVVNYACSIYYTAYLVFVSGVNYGIKELLKDPKQANSPDSLHAFVLYNAFDNMQSHMYGLVTNLRNAMNNANGTPLNNMPNAETDIPYIIRRYNAPVVNTDLTGQQTTAVMLTAAPVVDTSVTTAVMPGTPALTPLASNPNLAVVPPLKVVESAPASSTTEEESEGGFKRVHALLLIIIAIVIWNFRKSKSRQQSSPVLAVQPTTAPTLVAV